MQNSRVLLILLALFAAFSAHAAEKKVEPVYIEADHVEINEKRKLSIYRGDVSFKRGARELSADKIEVYGSSREPTKVIAKGSPARFVQPKDIKHKAAKAEANTMEYRIKDEKMVLNGNAQFLQEKNLFSGNQIIYNMKDDQVIAQGASKSDDRVKIVIFPEEQTDTQSGGQ